MYGSETLLQKEKERSKIRVVQMDNDIRRMDRVPNARIMELCGVKKGLEEKLDEGVLRWPGHVERMESERIATRVYVREYAGSRSVSIPQKRWIDTVKECLKKRGLDIRQARRMVQDRCKRRGFVWEDPWGVAWGMNP